MQKHRIKLIDLFGFKLNGHGKKKLVANGLNSHLYLAPSEYKIFEIFP